MGAKSDWMNRGDGKRDTLADYDFRIGVKAFVEKVSGLE